MQAVVIERNPDQQPGLGFLIDWVGRPCYSVTFPDGTAEKFRPDEIERRGYRVVDVEVKPKRLPAPVETLAPPSVESVSDVVGTVNDAGNVAPLTAEETGAIQQAIDDAKTEESPQPPSEADQIREFLAANPNASNKDVVAALKEKGIDVTSSQVSAARKSLA